MSSQHSSRAKRSEVDTEMAAVAEAGRLNHMNASAAVFGNLGFVQLYRDHGYDRTPCIAQRERPHPSSLRSPCYRCIPGGPQQDDTMPSSPCALSGRSESACCAATGSQVRTKGATTVSGGASVPGTVAMACVLKGESGDVEGRQHEPCCASDGGRPSGPAVQAGAQTTASCAGKEPGVVSVAEKARRERVR